MRLIKILFLLLLVYFQITNVVAENKKNLIIGKVAESDIQKNYAQMKSLVDYVSGKMADVGIEKGEVYFAKNHQEMIEAIMTGKVDWVTDSLFSALIFADKTNAEIFLRRMKKEIPKDHTVFAVLKTSEVNSLDDLERKIILFEGKNSTSSYFIPYYELLDEGYILTLYGKGTGRVSGIKKRLYYRFAKKKQDILKEVLKSGGNVGVFNNNDYDALNPQIRKKLKVIHKTASYPRAVELVRSDLDIDIKNKLKKILLESESQTKASVILNKSGTKRFYEFVAEGRDSYVYLKSLIKHGVVPVIHDKN